jgi:transglutaminase-like putative cysteine protease
MMLDPQLLAAPVLDHARVDLDAAYRVTYLLDQTFRYEYDGPVRNMRHRLVVLPPVRHGTQHLRAHRLDISGAATRRETRRDARGNTVVRLRAERVEQSVEFRVGALVERLNPRDPARLPASALTDSRLLRPTRLTAADDGVRELAASLGSVGATPAAETAAQICAAVYRTMTYEYGITSVRTTAAEALAGGRGVCQDSAHVMLALCHLLALPARYVSGHLLGQGGTHAWVEVVVPDGDHAVAMAFDPCHGKPATAHHLTVATGRDYADVPPTSGSYVGAVDGRLSTSRRVAVLDAA